MRILILVCMRVLPLGKLNNPTPTPHPIPGNLWEMYFQYSVALALICSISSHHEHHHKHQVCGASLLDKSKLQIMQKK